MANLSDLFPAATGGTTNVPSTITYTPAMMQYDGASSYYSRAVTLSSNAFTVVARFKIDQFTDANAYEALFCAVNGATGNEYTPLITVRDDTNAVAGEQNKMIIYVHNTVGTYICTLLSNVVVADGQEHTLLFSFNGDTGAATFLIDGVDADDTGWGSRVAPTTGTLNTSLTAYAGTLHSTLDRVWSGSIGFLGFDDQYISADSGFFDSNGNPIKQDETTWANSAWGAQPLIWNEHGDLQANAGSAGAATLVDTITVADEAIASPVMNYQPAAMVYNGTSNYMNLTSAADCSAGVAIVARFRWDGGTITSASGFNRIIATALDEVGYSKFSLAVVNDETGDSRAGTLTLFVQSNTGTTLCVVYSNTPVSDGEWHTVLASYDPSAGTAVLYVDGVSDINTGASGHTLTTGTIASGTGDCRIGARSTPDRYFDGPIGFFGVRGAYLTNYSDFFDSNGYPIKQDETTWANSGWGSQPLFWNEHGDMVNNKGSAGAMAENGTIVVADQDSTFYGLLEKWYMQSFIIAVSDETTALTTGTAKITFRMPYAFTLSEVRASVATAPTGAALQVDINEGGASILSTVLSIDAGEETSTTAATPAVISDAALADDAEITIDIDQVGSTVAGAGLKVYLIGNKA